MPAKLTTEQFITKANLIHGELYNYSLVEYTGNRYKVSIVCPTHGQFEQTPNNHLNGQQCPICSGKIRYTTETFSAKANLIHNNNYDYSLVNYTDSQSKVKIICKKHGVFEQKPNNHIHLKQGCPACALIDSGYSRTKFKDRCIKNNNGLGVLYILHCFNDTESFYKIGITSNSVKTRYSGKREMPYAYRVIDEIIGDPEYIFNLETKLHQQHKEHKYIPSIPFNGSAKECFKEFIVKQTSEAIRVYS